MFFLQQKETFMALLKENTALHRSSRWNDWKRKLENTDAYKQCESSTQREDWFREHVRTLPERTEEVCICLFHVFFN